MSSYADYAQIKGWTQSTFATLQDEDRVYFEAELARHGLCSRGLRILEMGFGNGTFLRFARESDAEIVGIEVQSELIARAASAGFEVFTSLDETLEKYGEGGFDLVIAFDVLEHLSTDEILDCLGKLRKLVDPKEGHLLARFPNGDSPFALVYENGDYTHKTFMGRIKIEQFLKRTGWSINYLGDHSASQTSLGRRILRAVKYSLRWALERTLKSLYWGDDAPSTLAMNYILVAQPTPEKK